MMIELHDSRQHYYVAILLHVRTAEPLSSKVMWKYELSPVLSHSTVTLSPALNTSPLSFNVQHTTTAADHAKRNGTIIVN